MYFQVCRTDSRSVSFHVNLALMSAYTITNQNKLEVLMRLNGVKNEENNPREIETKVGLEFCVSTKLRPNDVSACLSTALIAIRNPRTPCLNC